MESLPMASAAWAFHALVPGTLSPRAFNPPAGDRDGAGAADGDTDADGLILDCRRQLGWRQRLPARLGTSALWGGLVLLVLPGMAWAAVGAGVALPLLLRLMSQRPRAGKAEAPVLLSPGQSLAPSQDPQRQLLAEAFGISEASLFRARHAQICTVHHDGQGEIVAFSLPTLDATSLSENNPFGENHAHSVG